MGDSIPFDSLSARTRAGTEVGDGVIWDSIPFDSLSAGAETGTEVGNGVICDAIPFDSLAAGTGTEEPTPQSPTIPIPDPIPIAPSGAPTPISIPNPNPIPVSISIPTPIPISIPPLGATRPSGASSHLFSYELGQSLQSPCPCFRQIFYNGQCLCHYQVAHDGAGKKGSGSGAL